MGFQITVEKAQRKVPITIFHLSGSLNMASSDAFEAQMRQAIEQGTRYLLLDFKDVDAIRSAGLRSVQIAYKTLNPKSDEADSASQSSKASHLKLVNLSADVHYVFDVSGFLRNIDNYADMEEALNAFE